MFTHRELFTLRDITFARERSRLQQTGERPPLYLSERTTTRPYRAVRRLLGEPAYPGLVDGCPSPGWVSGTATTPPDAPTGGSTIWALRGGSATSQGSVQPGRLADGDRGRPGQSGALAARAGDVPAGRHRAVVRYAGPR